MKETVTYYKTGFKREGLANTRIRAAFLSDLHNTLWKCGTEGIVKMLEETSPDLVLIGGDMMTARPGHDFSHAAEFVRAVAEKHDVYYAPGNHELRADLYRETYGDLYDRYMSAISDCGITFLSNESVHLCINGQKIRLLGLEIPARFYKRGTKAESMHLDVKDYLEKPQNDELSILLAHNPKYLKEYFDFGCDLTLCGHYHGGMVGLGKHLGLIDPDVRLFPKMARGKFRKDGKTAVISAGMGEHTIPVRLNLPREIVIIDIRTAAM